MEIAEYRNIFEQEEDHFFYVSLHRLIIRLIDRYSAGRHLEILDAGCGTGGLMKLMKPFGVVQGIDFSQEAVKLARRRRLNVQQASVLKLPFRAKSFDLVTCIDVLYHKAVGDDVEALVELKRVLKTGGVLIIRVQADKTLKTAHDRFVHAKRRYTLEELAKKIKKSGLKAEMISYIHSPLWPVAQIMSRVEKLSGKRETKSGVRQTSGLVNRVLRWVLDRETDLVMKGIRPYRGLGVIAVVKKG